MNKAFDIALSPAVQDIFLRGQCSIPLGLALDNMVHVRHLYLDGRKMKEFFALCFLALFLRCCCCCYILVYLFYLFNHLMVDDFKVKVMNRPAVRLRSSLLFVM